MNKKITIAIVILVITGLWSYQQVEQRKALKDVQISLEGITPVSIGLTGATLDIKLRLHNPGTIKATLDRADYSLYGNDNYIGDGVILEKVDIPQGETRIITTEFDLVYRETVKTVWSALIESKIDWRVKGTAHFDTLFGTIDVPFDVVE